MNPHSMPVLFLLAACMVAAGIIVAAIAAAATQRRADRNVALTFPLPGVAEALAADQDIPLAHAQALEREFRRWFVAAAASPVMIGMCSKQVDAFWHELLWRPQLYEAYSRAVCGRVVRHVENVGGEQLAARCWAAYEAVWGECPPEPFWGPPPSAAAMARVKARAAKASDGGAGDGSFVCVSLSDGNTCDAAGHGGDGGHGGSHGCGGGGHGCGGGCGGH